MMQFIRDKAQGIVAWVIVAMLVIVFCFWGISGIVSGNSSVVVAKVKGQKITSDEVNLAYNRWLQFNSGQKGFDITKVDVPNLKEQIVKALAEHKALTVMLAKKGYAISDSVVIASLKANPDMQEDGRFSKQRFQYILRQLGVTEAEFERLQRDELMINQVQSAVAASGFALPYEVNNAIALNNQKRSFNYMVLPASSYLSGAKVSDAQITEYYEQHKSEFLQPEKVKLEYVELSINSLMNQAKITEQDELDYYNKNIELFSEPELLHVRHIMVGVNSKDKIDAIYNRLKSGANFVEIAKQESTDKDTAANGGDLGWINKNDGIPAEVFSLKKPNEFSPVVRSEHGWHIFQLIARKGGTAKSFAAVRSSIAPLIKQDATERLFSKESEELSNLAFENPKSLDAVSKKMRLSIKTTDFFDRNGGSGIAALPPVVSAAFSDEVLDKRNNSGLIRLNDDSYVVIRVMEQQPQKQLSLDEVRGQIIKKLQALEAQQQAKKAGVAMVADIKNGKLAKASWKSVQNAGRDYKDIDRYLLLEVFAMPKPTAGHKETVRGFQLQNGDYAVVRLNKVTDGVVDVAKDSALRDNIARQIAMTNAKLEYLSLQQQLINDAKINYTGAKP